MPRREALRPDARHAALVVGLALLAVADAERLDRRSALLGEHCDDRRRIEPAGQERTERDVAARLQDDRVAQHRLDDLGPGLEIVLLVDRGLGVPPSPRAD